MPRKSQKSEENEKENQVALPNISREIIVGIVVATVMAALGTLAVATGALTKYLITEGLSDSVASHLSKDERFQGLVKGAPGEKGRPGEPGVQGLAGKDGPTLDTLRPVVRDVMGEFTLMYFGNVKGSNVLSAPRGTHTSNWVVFVMPIALGRSPALPVGFSPSLPPDYQVGKDIKSRYLDQFSCYAKVLNSEQWLIVADQVLSGIPLAQADMNLGVDVCCLLMMPPKR